MKIATIHVVPTADLSALSPIRRCLVLVWLLALKDRATSIEHKYEPGVSKLTYQIDGQWHDLEPLPELLGPLVGHEVRNWINPNRFRRSLANQLRRWANRLDCSYMPTANYPFMLVIDPIWTIWGVSIQSEIDRGRVTFDLLECTDWAFDQYSLIRESMPEMGEIDEAEFFEVVSGLIDLCLGFMERARPRSTLLGWPGIVGDSCKVRQS